MAAVDWPVLGIQREAGQPRGMDWRAARAHPGSIPFILSKFVATWNGFPPPGVVSRRFALHHWRTTDVALACFTLYRSASRIRGAESSVSPLRIGWMPHQNDHR